MCPASLRRRFPRNEQRTLATPSSRVPGIGLRFTEGLDARTWTSVLLCCSFSFLFSVRSIHGFFLLSYIPLPAPGCPPHASPPRIINELFAVPAYAKETVIRNGDIHPVLMPD